MNKLQNLIQSGRGQNYFGILKEYVHISLLTCLLKACITSYWKSMTYPLLLNRDKCIWSMAFAMKLTLCAYSKLRVGFAQWILSMDARPAQGLLLTQWGFLLSPSPIPPKLAWEGFGRALPPEQPIGGKEKGYSVWNACIDETFVIAPCWISP